MNRRTTRSLVTLLAIGITFWLIWSRLYFVVRIDIPWWGMLLLALGIFLFLDWLIAKVVR